MTIARNRPDATRDTRVRVARYEHVAAESERARMRAHAREHIDELGLPVALDTRDADDLARTDREGRIAQATIGRADRACDQSFANRGALARGQCGKFSAYHRAREYVRRRLRGERAERHAPRTQNRYAIRVR